MRLFPNECLLNGYHEQPWAIKKLNCDNRN